MASGGLTPPRLIERGDVWLLPSLRLPNRVPGGGVKEVPFKMVIPLQSESDFKDRDIAVLFTSSDTYEEHPPYMVQAGTAEGFHHETVIDCRWVLTILKDEIRAGRFLFKLPDETMEAISESLVIGLNLF